MKRNIFNRMVVALVVSAVSLGGSLPTLAQQQPPPEQNQQENQDKQKQKKEQKGQGAQASGDQR